LGWESGKIILRFFQSRIFSLHFLLHLIRWGSFFEFLKEFLVFNFIIMNKEDKQFFIELIKGVEGKVDGLEGRFDGLEGRFDGLEGCFDGLEGRFDGFENQVGRNFEAIQENSRLIQENANEIRCLGVEFEDLKNDFEAFGEKQSVTDDRLKRVESDVKEVKKNVSDYSDLRDTVKGHSRLLVKLCR